MKKYILGRLDEPLQKVEEVPEYTSWIKFFGPGMVFAGMALGSGELIWWPYVVGKYGAFFLGWFIIFFLLPFAVQVMIGRYTVNTGESIYEAFHRVHHIIGWAIFLSILIIGSWVPGYLSAGCTAFAALTNFPPGWDAKSQTLFWTLLFMWLLFIIVLLGPRAYTIVEIVVTLSAVLSFGGMLVVVLLAPEVYQVAGDFFKNLFTLRTSLIPPNWDPADAKVLNTLLGYSGGTGGFWGLMYSYWVRDKGVGMSKYCGRVTSPITGKLETVPSTGFSFEPTKKNLENFKKWNRWLIYDVGFGIAFTAITTMICCLLSYAILYPQGLYPSGWELVVIQAEWFATLFGDAGRKLMWFIGFIFLIDTYLVAIDHFSRMVASNLQSNIPITRKWPYRNYYYLVFFLYAVVGSIMVFLAKPGFLILMTGVANQFIMVAYTFILLYVFWILLPKIHPAREHVKPHWIWAIWMLIAAGVWIFAFRYLFRI